VENYKGTLLASCGTGIPLHIRFPGISSGTCWISENPV
jgi:hypothetical protein